MSKTNTKSNNKTVKPIKTKDFKKENVKFWDLNVEDNEFNKYNYRARVVNDKNQSYQFQVDRIECRFGGLPNKDFLEESKEGTDAGKLTVQLMKDQPNCVELERVLNGIDERVDEELRNLVRPLAELGLEKKKKKGKTITDEDIEKAIDKLIEEGEFCRCVKVPKVDDDDDEPKPNKCTFKFKIKDGYVDAIIVVKNEDTGDSVRLESVKPMDLYEYLISNIKIKMIVEASQFWIMKASDRKYGVKLTVKRLEITHTSLSGGGGGGGGQVAEFDTSEDDDSPKEETVKKAEAPSKTQKDSKAKKESNVKKESEDDESSSDEKPASKPKSESKPQKKEETESSSDDSA